MLFGIIPQKLLSGSEIPSILPAEPSSTVEEYQKRQVHRAGCPGQPQVVSLSITLSASSSSMCFEFESLSSPPHSMLVWG